MKTILIITNTIDLTADYLIKKYSHKTKFFRLNTDRFFDYDITITDNDNFIRNKRSKFKVNTKEIDSLYYRKISMPNLDAYENKYWNLMHREIFSTIEGIAETTGNIALTRPSLLRRADNKIVQMKVAREVGFTTPNSLITNSDYEANSFCSKNNLSIVKPLSVGRVIEKNKIGIIQTNLVENRSNIQGLELSPAYFQNYIQKDIEIRLTVVGNKLFGVSINSTNQIDWRKQDASLTYNKVAIPDQIAKMCLDMMKRLEINFAAFDFIIRNDNYIFLELNANGQWLWLEEILKLNISDAIIHHLLGEII
ncbi:TPA: MvdC/MvdD family ATP grasp protein [Bacillus cereus]